jgi:predicted amidohydrolase/GNAT superfamily N-acetyltransferase
MPKGGKLSLKQFERKIRVRQLKGSDFDALVEMQKACFPGMATWARSQIESQIAIFPEGQLCIEYSGKIVASCNSLIVDFSQYSDWHDWKQIADAGRIGNHDPEGDTLYGIEMMVHPDFRGMKLARRLYEARKQLARQKNLMRIIIGGRIPGFADQAEDMAASKYVDKVIKKDLLDPVLTPQIANGFVLRGLIPDYFPSDTASRGYATHLEWTNLEYVAPLKRQFQAVSQVRLAVVQYQLRRIESFDDFATQVEFFVDTASDYRADFVVFPELFTLQLLSTVKTHQPGQAARKLAEFTPQYLDFFMQQAIRFNVNIVGGSQFTVEDGELYNVSYLFKRDGSLEKQYKLHTTPNERKWWGVRPGDQLNVFDTDRGRVAILLCYDVEFPELARIAAEKGAHIIFVPFNTDERNGYLRVRYCAQARCIENHVYVAISGTVGNLPSVENADIHYAQSGIFTPADFSFSRDGIASEGTPNLEHIIIHDVDLELLRRHRQTGTVRNWNDRRRDLYRLKVTEPDGDLEI